jgi:hypothetical protein
VKEILRSVLPGFVKDPLKNILNNFKYAGTDRFCPVCNKTSNRFDGFSVPPAPIRKDARCGRCGSIERHRLFWLFLEEKTNFFSEKAAISMLHVAPEKVLARKFANVIGDGYLTADLYSPKAMVEMDITNIQFPDESFDVIYCSHVLEHVHNDLDAMREFHRVLKADGWAVLLVPIIANETWEDASITDPKERQRAFGQADHVRAYGPDFIDRLRKSGFSVSKTSVNDLVNSSQAERMGLTGAAGDIFFCTK